MFHRASNSKDWRLGAAVLALECFLSSSGMLHNRSKVTADLGEDTILLISIQIQGRHAFKRREKRGVTKSAAPGRASLT